MDEGENFSAFLFLSFRAFLIEGKGGNCGEGKSKQDMSDLPNSIVNQDPDDMNYRDSG